MGRRGGARARRVASAFPACSPGSDAIRVVNLSCDNRPDATGVSVVRPVFGWEVASEERGEGQRGRRTLGGAAAAPARRGRPEDWSGPRWIAFEELSEEAKIVPGVHGNGDDLGDRGLKRPVVPAF